MAAIIAASLLPNFWTCGESYGPDDVALHMRLCQCTAGPRAWGRKAEHHCNCFNDTVSATVPSPNRVKKNLTEKFQNSRSLNLSWKIVFDLTLQFPN